MQQRPENVVKASSLPEALADKHAPIFALMGRYFDQKPCAEGVPAQNLNGYIKSVKTSQDDRALTDKASAD